LARSGRHDHLLGRDALDAPRAGAEHECLAGRLSYTISSSSSPTRGPPSPKKTPYCPRSGIVPPLVTATTRASPRATTVSATRSQIRRALRLVNSSDG